MSPFREVEIERPGRLLLRSMPGLDERLDTALEWMRLEEVTVVVCLLDDAEIADANEEYLAAIQRNDPRLPLLLRFPVRSPRAAANRDLARDVAVALDEGATVLIHCKYGTSRTPALARAVLRQLGFSRATAARRVAAARPREPR